MDLLVLGGSNVQQVTLIDVACVNTDTPSRIATPVKDVIKHWERMKVQKYEDSCFKRRARLVPFVVTTDGGFGKEADVYLQLASRSYCAKTNKSYSEEMNKFRSAISTAITRGSSFCIRGSHKPWRGRSVLYEDDVFSTW
eukprot:Selendium_serpulae@DN6519_c1_g1_i15.p2